MMYIIFLILFVFVFFIVSIIFRRVVEILTKGEYSSRLYPCIIGLICLFIYKATWMTNTSPVYSLTHKDFILYILFILFLIFCFVASIKKKEYMNK